MKVILTDDHDTLGLRGDVVEVKNGYGRNYLIPRQLAVIASASNVKRYAEERRQQEHKIEAKRAQAAKLAEKLEGIELTIAMQTGEEGRIFGTVTTQQVAEGLEAQGLPVDRRKITISEDIKTVGVYPASVRVSPEHTAEVKVKVVPTEEAI
ncbi:MAG: 50S ribosomal protein L9 [Bacteroidota bacterium]